MVASCTQLNINSRFSSTSAPCNFISGQERQFWAAAENASPRAGVPGDGGLGKVLWRETLLLLGLVKIGGGDAQRDRCSELHTGESHQAPLPGLHPSMYLGR